MAVTADTKTKDIAVLTPQGGDDDRKAADKKAIVESLNTENYTISEDDVEIDLDGVVTIKNAKFHNDLTGGIINPDDINISYSCIGNVFCK
ncbi:hypothetical protein OH764_32425 (plasmid) [Burkholderia sp. M6-3]